MGAPIPVLNSAACEPQGAPNQGELASFFRLPAASTGARGAGISTEHTAGLPLQPTRAVAAPQGNFGFPTPPPACMLALAGTARVIRSFGDC